MREPRLHFSKLHIYPCSLWRVIDKRTNLTQTKFPPEEAKSWVKEMADVEVRRDSFAETTTTTTKKTKKVKKTKRRESTDHGSEVTITEIEQTTTDNAVDDQEGYVKMNSIQSI